MERGWSNYKWFEYYTDLYKDCKFVKDAFKDDVNSYYKLIKLNSNDPIVCNEDSISILHFKSDMFVNNKSSSFISLCPFVNGENIKYIFPVFRPVLTPSSKNIVIRLGYCTNACIDNETDIFIRNNMEYTFIYVVWGGKSYSNLTKHQNVRVFHNIDTNHLVDLIQQSKFFLSRKVMNYDRYSSLLGMAVSFEKPLILDARTAQAYNIPGFVFHKDYTEIGKLSLITNNHYECTLNATRAFKTDMIQRNHSVLTQILNEDRRTTT